MLATVLLVLLLIVLVCMAIRDGRAFFADALKVIALIVVLVFAVVSWLPRIR